MNNLRKWFAEHPCDQGGLQLLCDTYKLRAARHGQYPNLVSLKYTTDSPLGDPLVQACRGVIVDEADNGKIVACPYNKFFNLGEEHAAKFDMSTAVAYEKLDGSLMLLYYWDGKWRVATSGSADASGTVNGDPSLTFATLFWSVWGKRGYRLPVHHDLTFMFELLTPQNRIVVAHKKSRIVLHGARDRLDCREMEPAFWASFYGWECVNRYPFTTLREVVDACDLMNPVEQEGIVLCDAEFRRVKVKAPRYVALHHLKEECTPRRMLQVVRTGEDNELLTYFPEFTELYQSVVTRYTEVQNELQYLYDQYGDLKSQKEFALAVVDHPLSGVLFSLRNGKTASIAEGLRRLHIDTLSRYMFNDQPVTPV